MLFEKELDFRARRHGSLRAAPCNGNGGGCGSESRRVPRVTSFEKGDGKGAIEAVSGAHRVDGVNCECRHAIDLVVGRGDIATISSPLEGNGIEAPGKQMPGGVFDAEVLSCVEGGLVFIGGKPCCPGPC